MKNGTLEICEMARKMSITFDSTWKFIFTLTKSFAVSYYRIENYEREL